MKLPYHEPKEIEKFSSDFFSAKSKAPYFYGSLSKGAQSPWLSFLGYQIRHDGKIRIRKSSLDKQITKQREINLNVAKALDYKGQTMRVGWPAAFHRARLRLMAMSVGRVELHAYGPNEPHEMCWVSGFKLLKSNKFNTAQIRRLDRSRMKLLSQLKKDFIKSGFPKTLSNESSPAKVLKKYGRPFSYFAQFKEKVKKTPP